MTLVPRRISLLVEYDGSLFHGWQRQDGLETVQGRLEQAVGKMLSDGRAEPAPVVVQGASRTDKGVHSRGQVAHFDDTKGIDLRNWVLGLTSETPSGISVLDAQDAPSGFHSRFDSAGKTYRYRILSRPVRPAIPLQAHYVRHPMNINLMQKAAESLIGEHDFIGFATMSSDLEAMESTRRELYSVRITAETLAGGWLYDSPMASNPPSLIVIEVCGDAFLYNMVRNIAGALAEIGRGKYPVEWINHCIQAVKRPLELPTLPANGLTLEWVHYRNHPHEKMRPKDIFPIT